MLQKLMGVEAFLAHHHAGAQAQVARRRRALHDEAALLRRSGREALQVLRGRASPKHEEQHCERRTITSVHGIFLRRKEALTSVMLLDFGRLRKVFLGGQVEKPLA